MLFSSPLLGLALYLLAAGWLPPQMRIIHPLEILTDSFVHAAVLVWLLAKSEQSPPRLPCKQGWSSAGPHGVPLGAGTARRR